MKQNRTKSYWHPGQRDSRGSYSVCQDDSASSHVPLGTLKIRTEGDFNMIVASEQIFYTSKNNMLFWWVDVSWPAFLHEEGQASVHWICDATWACQGNLRNTHLMSKLIIFETNPILCKTQLSTLKKKKSSYYSAFTPFPDQEAEVCFIIGWEYVSLSTASWTSNFITS